MKRIWMWCLVGLLFLGAPHGRKARWPAAGPRRLSHWNNNGFSPKRQIILTWWPCWPSVACKKVRGNLVCSDLQIDSGFGEREVVSPNVK
jgi:hypothetical protein